MKYTNSRRLAICFLCISFLFIHPQKLKSEDSFPFIVHPNPKTSHQTNDTQPVSVLTAQEQASLSPINVLQLLKEGNDNFIAGNRMICNNKQRIHDAANGQYPMAAILSCLDSRIPVEEVFQKGIGDLFVARVAGNIVNEDILGSLEYACKVSGAKVIVVMGHEGCGAIKAAIDNVELGNITSMLSRIQPAVKTASESFDGDKTSANKTYVKAVCGHNVHLAISQIREKSPILKELEEKKELLIIGGIYNIKTGKINFWEEDMK